MNKKKNEHFIAGATNLTCSDRKDPVLPDKLEMTQRIMYLEAKVIALTHMIKDFEKMLVEQETYLNRIRYDHELLRKDIQ